MAGSLKEQFKERWGKLSPAGRTGISLAALFGGMAAFAAFIMPSNQSQNAAQNTTVHQQRTSETNLILPQRKDTSLEALAAGQEAIRVDQQKAAQSQTEKDHQIEDLKKQLGEMSGKKGEDQQGQSQEVIRELASLSGRLDEVEKGKNTPNLADALPSPDKSHPDKGQTPTQESVPAQTAIAAKQKIRVIGAKMKNKIPHKRMNPNRSLI